MTSASRAALVLAVLPHLMAASEPAQQAGDSVSAKKREQAWDALRSRLPDEKYLRHSLAVEAIMREFARSLGEDKDEWALAGLLHDIDLRDTASDPSKHGVVGARVLSGLGMSQAVVYAVKSHDDRSGFARKAAIDKALYCADQTYWLILATGLAFPSKEFNQAAPDTVLNQIKGLPAKKDVVAKLSNECPGIGLTLPEVIEVSLRAMRNLSATL